MQLCLLKSLSPNTCFWMYSKESLKFWLWGGKTLDYPRLRDQRAWGGLLLSSLVYNAILSMPIYDFASILVTYVGWKMRWHRCKLRRDDSISVTALCSLEQKWFDKDLTRRFGGDSCIFGTFPENIIFQQCPAFRWKCSQQTVEEALLSSEWCWVCWGIIELWKQERGWIYIRLKSEDWTNIQVHWLVSVLHL